MKLGNRHIFKMVRIIKKTCIRDYLIEIIKNRSQKDREAAGENIIDMILDVFSSEENEVMLYDFLADVSGKSVEEISVMPIDETKTLLIEIGKENNLNRFFQSVNAILKKN